MTRHETVRERVHAIFHPNTTIDPRARQNRMYEPDNTLPRESRFSTHQSQCHEDHKENRMARSLCCLSAYIRITRVTGTQDDGIGTHVDLAHLRSISALLSRRLAE
jgi:hypothetical protein